LLALVRRWRASDLRARIDSAAVVNAVLKSFLSGVPKGQFPDLEEGAQVERLLHRMARRVLIDEVRREGRGVRDAGRDAPCPDGAPAHLPDRGPGRPSCWSGSTRPCAGSTPRRCTSWS
jgi:hypothetical protein